MKEIIESGEFKISILNMVQYTHETQHNLDLDIQDIMSNPIYFPAEIQGDTM